MHPNANHPSIVLERRRAQRFDFQLPIVIRWKQGSEISEARSVSENLSSRGIYFSLPEGLRQCTSIEILMTLPNQVTLAGPSRVRCFGQVQRCDLDESAKQGIAAAFEKIEFLSNTEWPEIKPLSATLQERDVRKRIPTRNGS